MAQIKDWLFKTESGKYVLGQKPNWPLLVIFLLWQGTLLASGAVFEGLKIAILLLFLYWAGMEIVQGVNNFRKILGSFVFLATIFSLIGQLS